VFCERVREYSVCWEKRHKDALKGVFTNRQGRKEVPWPEIHHDFDDWEPKEKGGERGQSNLMLDDNVQH